MSLNYSLLEIIKLFGMSLKNYMFITLITCSILFTVVLIINKDNKIIRFINIGINVILIVTILYYYLLSLVTFKFYNPFCNIYFYFLNSIIYLIVNSIIIFKTKYKRVNYIFYGLSLINLLYALYMTYYFKNITLIVIGNIFPMIVLGNIIYVIYYTLVVMGLLTKKI